MPNFTFTGPQGQQITVSGPDGSTPAQAFQIMQQHMGQTTNNPAVTKQAGYQASDTGQFTPIQNAGQQAQAPTGNAALGALQGASNAVLGAGNSMAAGAYAALKPHAGMDEASQNFDTANQFLQGNQIGTPTAPTANINATDAARQAVQGAAASMAGAPQALYDTGVNKLGALANKLPWAPAVTQFINQHPALQKFQAATQGLGDVAANTVLPAVVGGTAKLAGSGIADAISPITKPLIDARNAGYVIPPSDAALKGGAVGLGSKALEGLAGSAKLKTDASIKNQQVTNDLAAQELGLPKGTPLTPDALDSVRAPAEAVYQKMGSLGKIPVDSQYASDLAAIGPKNNGSFPKLQGKGVNADITELKQDYAEPNFDAGDAMQQIKELRDSARSNYTNANVPGGGKNSNTLKALGEAQNQVADALLDQIDRFAASRPEGFDISNLGQQFRQARQTLAKVHTVEDAIKPGTLDVSANDIAKAMNGKRKVPLTGGLKTIADTYNNFGKSMELAGPLRNKTPINAMEGLVGGGLMTGGMLTKNPALWKEALVTLGARPTTRYGLLSAPFQNSMLPKAPMDPMLTRLLMGGAPAALNAQNQNPLLGNQK